MSTSILLSLALFQAAGATAPAQPGGPPAQASVATASSPTAGPSDASPPDPLVCRSVDVSGSAFPRKECHRLSIWSRMAREGS